MTKNESNIPVVIVGGGPVGLFLGICLLKNGIACKVLEKRKEAVGDSRSLGIHPVSLELFDQIDITSSFLEKGLKVKQGVALTGSSKLGEISFESCPPPHNYILICPQYHTERILREELAKLDPTALITGAEFLDFRQEGDRVITRYTVSGSDTSEITSGYLVGCDGKNSTVRKQASIHFSGKKYPDTYLMGDFKDHTDFGDTAAVFLPKEGLIESFPLPENMRRWVVKTDRYEKNPDRNMLTRLVQQRTGFNLDGLKNTMMSSFGVQHYLAEFLFKDRVVLAGDAAHVVSPIGGQGMNLGWLGAWKLAGCTSNIIRNGTKPELAFNEYQTYQVKRARKTARRAEMNMILGRKRSFPFFRNLLISILLNTPFEKKIARIFTMRGLENWWI